jgi:hypothetical protein
MFEDALTNEYDIHDKIKNTIKILNSIFFNLWYPSMKVGPGELSGIALDYELDDCGFESRQGLGIFSSPPRSDWLWGSPSLLSNGHQGLFPCG